MIADEKHTVERMVRLYCRRREGNARLCGECEELLRYALRRLDGCRFGDGKPTCRQCVVHCYSRPMAARMRVVMRWAGPRMLFYHPWEALCHLLRELDGRFNRR
ncbi:MAG: nitrous oxide-stimulated promoter family protein [Duncaniella sp.]|nr:nitrous oxide-stimulated promoter family protein [Duncaniella sp.]